ncbi:Protein of unknown function [Shimia marina]|uniref:Uncharacterized protein n=1 Tax=Shimia marina TaxID=321267 RepID=A0A0P1FFD5_9RHOB|nr:putative protein involved in outer membrane biogenesis [Shimia marina]SFD75939.1 Protein of unknown function [Shimia marina]
MGRAWLAGIVLSTSTGIAEHTEASTLTENGDHSSAPKGKGAPSDISESSCNTDDTQTEGAEISKGESDVTAGGRSRPPRRVRRYGVIALFSLLVPLIALAGFVFVLSGKPFVLPDWMRSRVEVVLNAQMQNFDVAIETIAVMVEDDWDPSIQLRGVRILPPEGGGAVNVTQVDARLAFAPLLERQIAFREVLVAGVSLTALRLEDGSVRIALGPAVGGGALQTDTDITTLGDQLEEFLDVPVLAALNAFRVEDVTLRFEDLRERRAWTVDGGHISLRRDAERVDVSSQLTLLGGRSYASTIEASLTTYYGTRETEFGLNFEDLPSQDIASQGAALSWLEIIRAPISGALRGRIDEEGALGNVNATLQISDGVVQPGGEVQPIPFQGMRSYLTYSPERRAIRFDELFIDSDLMRVSAFGEAFLRDFRQGLPQEFLAQLTLNEFRANPRALEDDPVRLERSYADFRLRLDPFELDLGQMVVRQSENEIVLNGTLGTEGADWAYALNGHMDRVQADDVLAVWPNSFKPKPRKWVSENILGGTVRDVDLAVRSNGSDMPDVFLDFVFEDGRVRAVKTMPPIVNGSGFGVLQDHQLHIAVEEGYVQADQGGFLDVSGSSFVVLDTRIKKSPGLVRAQATGSTTAVMSLLDREPLKLFTKAKLPVDFAPGEAALEGTIDLILKDKLPVEEVVYDIRGTLSNVVSDHFLPGKVMRGDLTVHATPERVDVKGSGDLAGIPVQAHWHMFGGKENEGRSWLSGTAELSAAALETFDVGLPKGTVREQGLLTYDMEIVKDQPPKLTLTSDLKGVVLSAPPLGWRKGAQGTGLLAVEMTLGKRPSVDAITLEAAGLSATGRISIAEGGGLDVAELDSFRVGNWLQGQGQLRGRGLGVPPAIVVTGGRLDMRRMPKSTSSGTSSTDMGPLSAQMNEIIVTDGIRLAPAVAELTPQRGGLSGSFNGNLNGGPFVQGTLTPHQNGLRVQAQSEQGGKIAVAMGVVKSATKGRLSLDLVPRAADGEYDGTLTMRELKVQKVPLIAELLNAISVVGLIEQLSGPGLLFSEVFARFRITPERLIVGEASAVGPSMGISANGSYSFVQSWFDLQGTLSPLYAVNVLGRPVSRRGEGLIGFNYTLRGPSQDPEISVNPLSVLTPGFFREIFRRPPPDLSN